MPISVKCPACGKGHKAPDNAAGRTLKCLACGEAMTVPAPEIDPLAILMGQDEPASTIDTNTYAFNAEVEKPPEPPPRPKKLERTPDRPKPVPASLPPLTTDDPPFWRRHLHWLLVVAMIPLAASLMSKNDDRGVFVRITETMENASPEVRAKFIQQLENDEGTVDELLNVLPEKKLHGAWLPRSTSLHWGLAAAATMVYMLFFVFLASDGSARPGQVLAIGLLTATVGVGFLMLVQVISSYTEGRMLVGRGLITIVYAILKFIAFSYTAASDPENGFLLSLLGFTFGVGLCEELVKTIPLLMHQESEKGKTWRGLFIWGLASGAGFGIAEGILYSSRYYNGISGSGIYFVRFLSCVALHAIWSGSVAITMYLLRNRFENLSGWTDWIGPIFAVIGIPMVLHGLYDTCLKRDMNSVALLVAVASFGWLAFLTSRLYGTDDEAAKREMLREYKLRRQVIS